MLYTDHKVLFFKGNRYLRYRVSNDTVDPGYPKYISAGWSNMFAPFTDGIDAAVNWGNGVAYFFKGPQYVRVTIASNAVDAGYPLDIAPNWPALPSAFTSGISDIVEWPYCEVVGFNKQIDPQIHEDVVSSTVFGQVNRVYQLVAVLAQFASAPPPALSAAGEYRQYVRGVQVVGGVQVSLALGIKPRPADGDPNADFVEDASQARVRTRTRITGDRDELPGNLDQTDHYEPDRATGCIYQGHDYPFVTGAVPMAYTMDLDFKAVIIDTCNDNEEVATLRWSVFVSSRSNPEPRSGHRNRRHGDVTRCQ